MKADLNKELADLESRKKTALAKVEHDYYSNLSVHYMDKDRFEWAVNSINKTFENDKANLINSYLAF